MQINTDGLVIRESSVGENDRLITVLTREEGLIRAFARQAKASRTVRRPLLSCFVIPVFLSTRDGINI